MNNELEAFRYIVETLQRLVTDREDYIFKIYPKLETLEQYFLKMYQLGEQLGCPLEVMVAVFKAIQQGFVFVDLGNGLYREDNINLDYVDISEDEEGYIGCGKPTNYHYILDYDGCVFVEDYKKTWWLREDKSE